MNVNQKVTPLRPNLRPENVELRDRDLEVSSLKPATEISKSASPAKKSNRSWNPYVLGSAALLLFAALAAHYLTPYILGPVVATDIVKKQDIVQTVVASGLVQTPFRIAVASQVAGKVVDVLVDEGQTVASGDLLVQLDNSEAVESVRLAQSVVMQSENRLKQLSTVARPAAIESKMQALATLSSAERAFERAEKLQKNGYATRATLDETRKARDIARSQVKASELQVVSNSPGGSEYVNVQSQLAQAYANLSTSQTRLTYTQIRAPRRGIVINRNVEKGSVVQPGIALMTLAPSGETQAIVQIDEVNLGQIQMNQRATISADAFPNQRLEGQVSSINSSVDPQRGSVEVKLTVINPPDYLRQDMTVSVEIETAHHAQVIVVDVASIRDLSSAKPWVMVVDNGRARRRDIALGVIGDTSAEVLAGIKTDDSVIRGPTTTLSDGQRVRTK
jgi:HlyD family secretion protein